MPPQITLSFVAAREAGPPLGATPAHWRLLTTHPVATLADATQITHFYRQRWTIEQLFRVMKTKGFDIEAVRVAGNGPFENLTTATLIAAIQVLQMAGERDGAPQAGHWRMSSMRPRLSGSILLGKAHGIDSNGGQSFATRLDMKRISVVPHSNTVFRDILKLVP